MTMTENAGHTGPADAGAGLPRLNRSLRPAAKAPVRIVHLGLGAFHRSHQAWYTHRAGDAAEWGIASFTGRRPDAALALAEQDGLFTLVERGDAGDSFEIIGSIVAAVDGADVARLAELVSAPATAIITLTITEAAYRLGADGRLDLRAADVVADLDVLARGAGNPATPLGRLVFALAARRAAGTGPLAVVCCDNLASNGTVARRAVTGLAARLGRRARRLDRGQRQFRQHLRGPDHAADHGGRPRRRRGRLRLPGHVPGGRRTVPQLGPQRRLPGRAPPLGGRRGGVRG